MSDLQKTAQALATALITEGVLDKPAIEKYYGGGYSTTQLHFGNLYADALSQAAVEKLAQTPDQFEQVMTRFAQGAVQLNDTEFSVAIGNLKRDMLQLHFSIEYDRPIKNASINDINFDAQAKMLKIFSAMPDCTPQMRTNFEAGLTGAIKIDQEILVEIEAAKAMLRKPSPDRPLLADLADVMSSAAIHDSVLDADMVNRYYCAGSAIDQKYFGSVYAQALAKKAADKLIQDKNDMAAAVRGFSRGSTPMRGIELVLATVMLKEEVLARAGDLTYKEKLIDTTRVHKEISFSAMAQMVQIFADTPGVGKRQLMHFIDVMSGAHAAVVATAKEPPPTKHRRQP